MDPELQINGKTFRMPSTLHVYSTSSTAENPTLPTRQGWSHTQRRKVNDATWWSFAADVREIGAPRGNWRRAHLVSALQTPVRTIGRGAGVERARRRRYSDRWTCAVREGGNGRLLRTRRRKKRKSVLPWLTKITEWPNSRQRQNNVVPNWLESVLQHGMISSLHGIMGWGIKRCYS